MSKRDGTVLIEHGVVENENQNGGGFLPMIWVNSRSQGDWYRSSRYDLDDAIDLAEREAKREASTYVGDWEITIRKR